MKFTFWRSGKKDADINIKRAMAINKHYQLVLDYENSTVTATSPDGQTSNFHVGGDKLEYGQLTESNWLTMLGQFLYRQSLVNDLLRGTDRTIQLWYSRSEEENNTSFESVNRHANYFHQNTVYCEMILQTIMFDITPVADSIPTESENISPKDRLRVLTKKRATLIECFDKYESCLNALKVMLLFKFETKVEFDKLDLSISRDAPTLAE